ncbi:MAG: PEP-CTERM system histidine kinase PrsK [Gammaproteobacteria bacterium]|jgi:putative PEP-CTERM system histidine kinase
MEVIGTLGYSLAALSFFVFAVLLATNFRRSPQVVFLAIAVIVSLIWGIIAASFASGIHLISAYQTFWLETSEMLRMIAWLVFLEVLLLHGTRNSRAYRHLKRLTAASYVLFATIFALLVYFAVDPLYFIDQHGYQYLVIAHLLMASLGLFLIEQLLRHIDPDQRWSIKYLCVGLAALFTYDFYLYADALLLRQIDNEIWAARGFVNALIVPLIAISASRTPDVPLKFFVSHKFAFHTTALLASGLYLLAMGLGGYYIKIYGGEWGGMLQVVFLFGAATIFASLVFSGSIRASLRVFLAKHFFQYRYDYREEWLRIIESLSHKQQPQELRLNALRALADIVESPAGLLWVREEQDDFQLMVNWNCPNTVDVRVPPSISLIEFLHHTQWIIDVHEYANQPEAYQGLEMPPWLLELPEAWLVVPLMHQTNLLGFAVLTNARARFKMNWEVRDILRTAGRQVAGYLVLLEVNLALASARQFEAFNRLSAFVVHDLKNIVAQLSLVERNAVAHRNNPEFIDDAFTTIANATEKMNRLLAQLRTQQAVSQNVTQVELGELVQRVVQTRSSAQDPKPQLAEQPAPITVLADRDRLRSVLEHLVQNAQEATKKDGFVRLRLYTEGREVKIVIEDNGCGMDDDFIQDKLFKPFETTKGNAGMGIGVYEAREFVRALGGSIDVASRKNHGTTFVLSLPLAEGAVLANQN